MRQYFQIFMLGGPVGLAYAIRLAWVERQLQQSQAWMDREKANHAAAVRGLRERTNQLVSRQQGLNIAASQFRAYCDKAAAEARVVRP